MKIIGSHRSLYWEFRKASDLSSKLVIISNKEKLNPYYLTGFVDGEGCFLINITPRSDVKTGYTIWLAFKITLHSKDKVLLLLNLRILIWKLFLSLISTLY